MLTQLKAAAAGAGNGGEGGAAPRSGATGTTSGPTDAELGLPDDAALREELDGLSRQQARSHKHADAEARLAELKRRMGQP